MPVGYEYDIFLSYKRSKLIDEWVGKFFLRYFPDHLSEAIGRPARIFWDQDSIDWGEDWKEKIHLGLRTSKILLAVCTPLYFQSEWCVSEWKTFALRENAFKPKVLRMPIRHSDGERFHDDANAKQMIDFRECSSNVEAFWKSKKALIFEKRLKELTTALATIIDTVPPFQPDWQVIDHQSKIQHISEKVVIEQTDLSDNIKTPLLRIS